MITKSELAIYLSKLSGFTSPDHKAEQYVTDPEIAAETIWNASMLGDIHDRKVADLGCGPGMLGIGCALLGCRGLYFVDADKHALALASSHFAKLESERDVTPADFEHLDINEFDTRVDTVITNPPFGTRQKHADRKFLEKAFSIANVVYSFHKTNTIDYLRKYAEKNGWKLTHNWNYAFPLKATQSFHTRKTHRIEVSALRFTKI